MTDTVEEWARAYVESTSLEDKCAPAKPPTPWTSSPDAVDLSPGRPPQLTISLRLPMSSKLSALKDPRHRAELMHKFWHHELQAAELMAWALLRFPETPVEFRQGLVRILQDEVRHMGLYEAYLLERGVALGDFPVRDWIWERVQDCTSPITFVALLGMGFEGANIEHAARFSARFREVGDEAAAKIQDQVGLEEIAHVRFATRWFRAWTGDVDYQTWRKALPDDVGPLSVRGKQLKRQERIAAEMPEEFLNELDRWGRP